MGRENSFTKIPLYKPNGLKPRLGSGAGSSKGLKVPKLLDSSADNSLTQSKNYGYTLK